MSEQRRRTSGSVSARVRVSPDLLYSGELPPPTPPPKLTLNESAWRNIALTLAVILVIGSGGVVIFWPRGATPAATAVNAADPSAGAGASGAASPGGPPSGVAMPGEIPGWRQTFAEDFTGNLDKWGVYEGEPSGDPGGWFLPSHVTTDQGKLVIKGYKENTPNGNIYATGGLNSGPSFSQTYGRFEFRFRMDVGYGVSFIFLLWPANEQWPPEIDVGEDNGLSRNFLSSTLHYGTFTSHDLTTKRFDGEVDFSQWHTVGVDWAPGKLEFRLDGAVWHTIDSANVPSQPMVMAIQSQAWDCESGWSDCPNSSTPPQVNLEVDWAVAYSPA